MRLALYQPDIPPNTGTLLRLGACLGLVVDVIEPCGFPFSDKALRRAGMDYAQEVEVARHLSWNGYLDFLARDLPAARLILLTTKASVVYTDFTFGPDDILLLGQEGSGVPDEVHERADARVRIPMKAGMRSLNVAIAGAMVAGEALRQTSGFPQEISEQGGM